MIPFPFQQAQFGRQIDRGVRFPFSAVEALLHFDGTNGSTTFTDSSSFARTYTAQGNAQISTAASVFGGASGLFDGTGDGVKAGTASDWTFLSNGAFDWTIEVRTKISSFAGSPIIITTCSGASNTVGIYINVNADRTISFFIFRGINSQPYFSVTFAGGTYPNDTSNFHAMSFDFKGGANPSITCFVDGASIGSATQSNSPASASAPQNALTIGGASTTYNFTSNMDELRIVKGYRLHANNYTVANSAFPDS